MSLKIVETRQAEIDVMRHANSIAGTNGLKVARRFLEAVQNSYDRLADFPGIGTSRDYGNSNLADMRMWPIPGFRNHLVFYLASEKELSILHVLHGAQDLSRIFREE